MFRFSLFMSDLLKAMTHKYVRRIPKGVTKTGATKYIYYYAGQEGHGQGIAHESEIVQGASFAFGEHGKTRYHAHISKVDGDKVTVQYDDGDKKGQKETMTKKQFQALVHGEHKESIKQAQAKAEKQLKDFQTGKEKGVKVKQSTLDKLAQRVENLDELAPTKENDAPLGIIKDGISKLPAPLPVKQVSPNFQGSMDAPVIHLGIFGKSTLRYIDPTVHKNVFIEKTAEHLNLYVEKANKSGDIMLLRSTPSKQPEVTFSVSVPTKQLQDILGQDRIGATPSFKYKDNTLFFKSNIPFDDPVYFGRRTEPKTDENNFYKIDGSNWQKPEVKQGTPQQKGADAVIERLKKYQDLSNLADSLSYSDHVIYEPGVHVRRDYDNILHSDTIKNKAPDRYKTLEQLKQDLIVSDRVNLKGDLVDDDYKNMLDSLEATEKSKDPPVVAVSKRWDIKEKARWEKIIKPALKALGLPAGELHHVNKTKKINVVDYKIPLHFLNSKPEGPEQALKDLFDDTKVPEVKYAPLTEKQQNLITKYNKNDVKGFKSFVFEDDSVGDEIENEEMGSKDPDKLYIYAEGTYADREALNKLGFKFVQKKEGEKNVSYYKYKAPISKL